MSTLNVVHSKTKVVKKAEKSSKKRPSRSTSHSNLKQSLQKWKTTQMETLCELPVIEEEKNQNETQIVKMSQNSIFQISAVVQHQNGLLEIDLWPSIKYNNIWDQILGFYS